MPLQLSRGDDSRTDGAPASALPGYQDAVMQRYQLLIDAGELPELAMVQAVADVDAMLAQNAAGMQAGAEEAERRGADRRAERAAAQGVNPDDLPAGEFGGASRRTVRDANLPIDEQEARLEGYQNRADDETRELREGSLHGPAGDKRRWDDEYGFGTGRSKTGKTDEDYYNQWQGRFKPIRLADGTLISSGPEPTPEDLANLRKHDEWSNENPGSERQATYDPPAYEEYLEGVRDEWRAAARADEVRFGTGPTDPGIRDDLGLPPLAWTPLNNQAENRAARARSEERMRLSRRTPVYLMTLENETGMPPGTPIEVMEAERVRRRNAERTAKKDSRRNLVAQRGILRGAGLAPAVGDFRNRTDDLINRLGEGDLNDWQRVAVLGNAVAGTQIANPTPFGVDAVGAQNAQRMAERQGMGVGVPNPPIQAAAAAAAESNLPLPEQRALARDRNDGVLPANHPAGMRTLQEIEENRAQGGWGFGWSSAEDGRAMVDDAVAEGIPEADAMAYFRRQGYEIGPPVSQAPLPPASTARPRAQQPRRDRHGRPVSPNPGAR